MPTPVGRGPSAPDPVSDVIRQLSQAPGAHEQPGASTPTPPVVGPDVLAGFEPSVGLAEMAAAAGPGAPPNKHRSIVRRPGPTSALVVARTQGTRLPSPWALAGLIPVAVLLTSAAYSAWWRRRSTVLT